MKNNIKTFFSPLLILFLFSFFSCDRFLDELPDNRAEIKNPKEIKEILVAAYTNLHPQLIFEKMSDNVMDNGSLYGHEDNINERMYLWEDTFEDTWESPQWIWDGAYSAIANANQALEAIKNLGFPESTRGAKAEALLCRAYHHFLLSTVFCMAYDEITAEENLGLPYITLPEKEVGIKYKRGTLKELYEKIDIDIEEALKDVSYIENDVPLYHFNKNAAYAFAARFNLFYKKDLSKVINYATEVLGPNPISVLRNFNGYAEYTNPDEWTYRYINKVEPANLLLITNVTKWGWSYAVEGRFGHSIMIANSSTFWSTLPPNIVKKDNVYARVVGPPQALRIPKLEVIFEVTDVLSGNGQPHGVVMAFTTDETLLCRAEAYVLLKEYNAAAKDLSTWYKIKGAKKECSALEISDFYARANIKTVAKPLNPNFEIEKGMQTNMLQAVLHARRIEGIHEGVRFVDIKRYGIEISHNREGDEDIVLEPHDLRTAIQIPKDVLDAGLEANPR